MLSKGGRYKEVQRQAFIFSFNPANLHSIPMGGCGTRVKKEMRLREVNSWKTLKSSNDGLEEMQTSVFAAIIISDP